MNNKDFLQWIHDRLVYQHNENKDVDYLIRLRKIIESKEVNKDLLIPALRQYRHNDSDDFVFGYDKDEIDSIFRRLTT